MDKEKNILNSKVSIIILNWNGLKDTIKCLESLKKITYPNYEVIVVDNGSEGNDADILEEQYKDYIRVIRNKENLGFAGGNNVGIRKVLEEGKSEYILLLNNDTIVKENFLDELIKYYDYKTGICAPLILNFYNQNEIWSSGGKFNIFTGTYSNDTKRNKGAQKETDFISGCCWLVRIDVFKKVGLLDEKYFLYSEDVDFCYRLRQQGYKLKVILSSIIFHKVSESTKNKSSIRYYYFHRSKLIFINKNYNGFKHFFYLNVNRFIRYIRILEYSLKGKKEIARSIKKALKEYKYENSNN